MSTFVSNCIIRTYKGNLEIEFFPTKLALFLQSRSTLIGSFVVGLHRARYAYLLKIEKAIFIVSIARRLCNIYIVARKLRESPISVKFVQKQKKSKFQF